MRHGRAFRFSRHGAFAELADFILITGQLRGRGLFLSSRSNSVSVKYADQNIKQAVIENGIIDFFGQTLEKKLTVVIAGGTGYSKIPVVLGLIEEAE